MAVRRKTESSTLAFLDIISCGLGAVILIFLIIKHNTDVGSDQEDDLQAQLASLVEENQKINTELEALRRLNAEEEQAGKSLEDNLANAEGKRAAMQAQNTSDVEKNKILEGERDAIEIAVPVDPVEIDGQGAPNFIVGMTVEGDRIAVLIDRSTSMTHPTLERAILAKFDTDSQRRAAPKWRQTVRSAKWLMARIPTQSQFVFIGFGEQAEFLSPGTTWVQSSDETALQTTIQNVAVLSPEGGTNLESAVDKLMALSPAPTDIYIVTDGLPTKGGPRVRCANGRLVTSQCRQQLMGAAAAKFAQLGPRRNRPKVNTILLPMTGDPQAISHFWGLSRATGGLVLSPTEKWP